MKKLQFAVIGLGRFGTCVARELVSLGYEVLGIDRFEDRVNELSDVLTHAVLADTNDEEVLRSLGIRNFDCVVVANGDDIQSSILTAIQLKDLGVKNVVARAMSDLHGKVLQKVGVDRVIFPERDMGIRVAHQLVSPSLLDYIELSKEYTIAELSVTKKICGIPLKELNTRSLYGCTVVAIQKKTGVIIAPTGEDVVNEEDIMVVIGTNRQIENFQEGVT